MHSDSLERLCALSTTRRQPLAPVDRWPATLAPGSWHFSPELISLHGTPEYEALDVRAQQRLSFFEAVNFFSLNLHGERFLVAGLAARLYRTGNEVTSRYLHHFLEEENNHMTWFGGFCQRYAGKVYADKKLALLASARDYEEGEEDLLFFARAVIFEEIGDAFNRRMARDERLHPLAREINRRHHAEEKRHLAFGRQRVTELHTRHANGWTPEARARIADELRTFLQATWAEYTSAEVYADAGLDDPYALRRRACESPAAHARRRDIGSGCARFLNQLGVM